MGVRWRIGVAILAVVLGARSASAELVVELFEVFAVEDAPFVATVARIHPAAGESPGDYSVRVDWADGRVSPASVVAADDGKFDVIAGHTYTAPGSYWFVLSFDSPVPGDDNDMGVNATVTPIGIAPRGVAACAVEGVPFRGVVATFNPEGVTGAASATTSVSSETLVIAPAAGSARRGSVLLRHTFGAEGHAEVSVTILDSTGASAGATSWVRVGEAVPALRATLERVAGEVTLRGTYSDTTAEAHEATIDWGDGATEVIPLGASQHGEFERSHVYSRGAARRIFSRRPTAWVSVTVSDAGGTPALPVVLPDPFAGESPPPEPKPSRVCKEGPASECRLERLFLAALERRPLRTEVAAMARALREPGGRAGVLGAVLLGREAQGLFVRDAHRRFLSRMPTPEEWSSGLAALDGGATRETVLAGLLGSPEYRAAAADGETDPDAAFVRRLSEDVLGRTADPPLHARLREILAAGGTAEDFAAEVLFSDEARRRAVHEEYARYLHRPPGTHEVVAAMEHVASGGTVAGAMAARLIGLLEEIPDPAAPTPDRGGADQRFVRRLHRDLLGREADSGVVARWASLIGAGLPREHVAGSFLGHAEFRRRETDALYVRLLGREPTDAERAAVAAGSDLVLAVASSPEYLESSGGGTPEGLRAALARHLVGVGASLSVGSEFDLTSGEVGLLDGLGDPAGSRFAAGLTPRDVATEFRAAHAVGSAHVEEAFQRFLGRAADRAGGAVGLLPLVERDDLEGLVPRLLATDEYAERGAPPRPGIRRHAEALRFLDALSRAALGRELGPGDDPEGLLDVLAGPGGRRRAAELVANSEAARRRRLAAWTEEFLGTPVADDEVDGTLLSLLTDGGEDEEVLVEILASDAYFARAHVVAGRTGPPTAADLVTALHVHLLGRQPEAAEVAFLTTAFPSLATDSPPARRSVVRRLLASPEFRRGFVTGLGIDPLDAARIRRLAESPVGLAALRVSVLTAGER